jgi:hypothetical protein
MALLATALGVALGLIATPASAAVFDSGGVKYVRKDGNSAITGQAKLTTRCPGGTRVIGGGQSNTGGYGDVHEVNTHPVDLSTDRDKVPDDAWRVTVVAENAATFHSYAICAPFTVTYVKETFAPPGTGFQSNELITECPGDKRIVGGGFEGDPAVFEITSRPSSIQQTYGWAARVDSHYSGSEQIVVHAICARRNIRVRHTSQVMPPQSQDVRSRACLESERLLGGGQLIYTEWGESAINSGYPQSDDDGQAPDDKWVTYGDYYDDDGTTLSRILEAYIICERR